MAPKGQGDEQAIHSNSQAKGQSIGYWKGIFPRLVEA